MSSVIVFYIRLYWTYITHHTNTHSFIHFERKSVG